MSSSFVLADGPTLTISASKKWVSQETTEAGFQSTQGTFPDTNRSQFIFGSTFGDGYESIALGIFCHFDLLAYSGEISCELCLRYLDEM